MDNLCTKPEQGLVIESNTLIKHQGCKRGRLDPNNALKGWVSPQCFPALAGFAKPPAQHTEPHAELEKHFLQTLIKPDTTQTTRAHGVISLWVHLLH